MNSHQAAYAVPLLNGYAHDYLGLGQSDALVSAGLKNGEWTLIVATATNVEGADSFDHAKHIIDEVADRRARSSVERTKGNDCTACGGRGYVVTDGPPGWEESTKTKPCPECTKPEGG